MYLNENSPKASISASCPNEGQALRVGSRRAPPGDTRRFSLLIVRKEEEKRKIIIKLNNEKRDYDITPANSAKCAHLQHRLVTNERRESNRSKKATPSGAATSPIHCTGVRLGVYFTQKQRRRAELKCFSYRHLSNRNANGAKAKKCWRSYK